MKPVIRGLLLAILLLPGLAVADFLAGTGSFDETIALDGTVTLDVTTGSGSVEIRAGTGHEARIVGKVRVRKRPFWQNSVDADAIIQQVEGNPPIKFADSHLRVGHFEDRKLDSRVSMSYVITVPEDTSVVAATGSGSIMIRDIAEVSADTGSGRIELDNISGAVKADTGSGSVDADGVAGAFEAHTGSGSVYLLQTAPGDVRVNTGSGSTELRHVVGAVDIDTGSGRIVVEGRPEGRWKLDAGSASITLDLPDDAAFTLDAETDSGGITVDHPLTVQGKISKKHIRGDVRGGGPLLVIDTGSGSIYVR